MKKPYFSVIIPTLNEEKYLPHLLEDLSSQTLRDFEVIVVDGHSNDDTVKLAKRYKKKLPLIKVVNSPRRHVCAQRNLGAQQSQGQYLVFMDADNRLPPYFLLGVAYKLQTEPTDLATCWINPDKTRIYDETIASAVNYATELAQDFRSPFFCESMTICKSQVFAQVGGFDEAINYAESRVIASAIIKNGYEFKIYRDPRYTYSFRRIRKYGPVKLAANIVQHQLTQLFDINLAEQKLEDLYPMKGGKFFDKPYQRKQAFIKIVKKVLSPSR